MAKNEITRITYVPSTVVCICFLILQFGQGLLGQVLRMRIRHVVLRGIDVFFVVILVWPGRKIRGVELRGLDME